MLLDELKKRRDRYKLELEERIKVLQDLKQSIEKNVQRRGELRREIDSIWVEIKELLKEKEKLRGAIAEAKEKRAGVQDRYRELREKVRERERELLASVRPDLPQLRRRLRRLEFAYQTKPLTPEKDKEYMEKILALRAEIEDVERKIEADEELRRMRGELEELRKILDETGDTIKSSVEKLNLIDERLNVLFPKLDRLREEMDLLFKEFRTMKDEQRRTGSRVRELEKTVRDYDQVITELERRSRSARRAEIRDELKRRAQEIYEKFLKGMPISEEELMILKKAGFI